MKILALLTAIVALAVPIAAAGAAPPAVELADGVLTVSGAEVASVRPSAPATPEPTLAVGIALLDDGLAFADDGTLAWQLSTGVYTVTALSAADAAGLRETVTETVSVDAPPPPQPPTRMEQVRSAVFGLFAAITAYRDLAISDAELFQAVRAGPLEGGPLIHPTPAGAAIRP